MIDEYRGQPIIWGSHIDWFTKEVFANKEEFIGFYTEEVSEDDGGDFSKEITDKMQDDGYTGKGCYFYGDRAKYVGEYKDGKMHGQGTYTYGEGAWEGATYVGEFSNRSFNGQGTLTLPDGAKYVGEFKDDKRHGQGTYTFANGTIQEGLFENNKYIGKNSEEPKAKEEVCAKGLTTPLAQISYIFLSFAHFTDGEVSKEEREEAITNSMQMAHKWSYTKDEAIAAWQQAAKTHAECETIKDIFSIYIDVLNTLGSREFFDNEQKNELIVRLERIMNVDHVQHENEIMWINKIKEIWKLEEDSSQDSSDEEKSVLEKAMEGITKKDLAEKIVKNIEVSTKNPEAYAFVKSVSSKNADYTKIEENVERWVKFIDFADEDGYTALHYACWDNKVDIVELLMDNGANVNALSSMKESPLHMAVFSGHVSVVDLFIEHSALVRPSKGDDVDFTLRHQTPSPVLPKDGSNIIRDAVLNGHWDIFDLLVKHISPDLSIFEEPCVIGVDGETNFFAAIEIFYKNNNIDYNKERLDVLRSVVESSPDTSEKKQKNYKKEE
jgi:hypothetical protein